MGITEEQYDSMRRRIKEFMNKKQSGEWCSNCGAGAKAHGKELNVLEYPELKDDKKAWCAACGAGIGLGTKPGEPQPGEPQPGESKPVEFGISDASEAEIEKLLAEIVKILKS